MVYTPLGLPPAGCAVVTDALFLKWQQPEQMRTAAGQRIRVGDRHKAVRRDASCRCDCRRSWGCVHYARTGNVVVLLLVDYVTVLFFVQFYYLLFFFQRRGVPCEVRYDGGSFSVPAFALGGLLMAFVAFSTGGDVLSILGYIVTSTVMLVLAIWLAKGLNLGSLFVQPS